MISKIYTNIIYRVFKEYQLGIPRILRFNPLFSPSVYWYLIGKDAIKEAENIILKGDEQE